MTISLAIKVNDGVVLASDSASTIITKNPDTGEQGVFNVYNNANKIFNLIRGQPIGAITWGAGSIGNISIETLIKDFREILTNKDETGNLTLNYTIEEIADQLTHFIYEEHYAPTFESWPKKPSLGFLVAGYSIQKEIRNPSPEIWQITFEGNETPRTRLVRDHDSVGINWYGEIEAIGRLIKGFSFDLPGILKKAGVEDEKIQTILELCNTGLENPFVIPPMPIQDAIDLATFLVEMTEQFSKFRPGWNSVGGPIEIGTITKHESFRWISRKHYYPKELNP